MVKNHRKANGYSRLWTNGFGFGEFKGCHLVALEGVNNFRTWISKWFSLFPDPSFLQKKIEDRLGGFFWTCCGISTPGLQPISEFFGLVKQFLERNSQKYSGSLDGIPMNRLIHEGTLYGNGVYLAEAVSKSDEYTTPHSGGLRSILICLSSLGRVTWLKMSSYRMGPKIYENNFAGN